MSEPDETPAVPDDPMTALAAGAAAFHELYEAYVAAGFAKDQAMQIICAMVQESMRNAS